MYCKYCGKEVDEKAEICIHCGRRIKGSVSSFIDNSGFTKLKPQKEPKSPGFAAFLGFTLGWVYLGPVGYLYLGQWGWFWLTVSLSILAGFLALIPLVVYFPFSIPFLCLFYTPFPFVLALHQYKIAKQLNGMIGKESEEAA